MDKDASTNDKGNVMAGEGFALEVHRRCPKSSIYAAYARLRVNGRIIEVNKRQVCRCLGLGLANGLGRDH